MPASAQPANPVVRTTHVLYTRSSAAAALREVTEFLGGHPRNTTEPSEPCPPYLGQAGTHRHVRCALDVDSGPVPSVRKIQVHEMGKGHRPWIGSGTTRVRIETIVERAGTQVVDRVRAEALDRTDADFHALRLLFQPELAGIKTGPGCAEFEL